MPGFFTDEEFEKQTRYEVNLDDTGPHCDKCGLKFRCESPMMTHTGRGEKKCLIIAEASGDIEDKVGKQLMGPIGQYFRSRLKLHSLQLDRDFWKINSICCLPKRDGNKIGTPTDDQIAFCRPIIQETIRKLQPEYIWLMGECANKSYLGEDFSNTTAGAWRGLSFPDRKTNAWVSSLWHPSYRKRQDKDRNICSVYDRDLQNAIALLSKEPFDTDHWSGEVVPLFDHQEIIAHLDKLIEEPPEYLFIDYEATGLKPYKPGHKIVSMSACAEPSIAYSWPYQYRDYFTPNQQQEIKTRWIKIVTEQRSKKGAHNLKFEEIWTRVFFDVSIVNWHKCTMNAAHILNPRRDYVNLNKQTFLKFGIRPYDKRVKTFFEASKGDYNRIEEVDLKELLEYGGSDSLYGAWLDEIQDSEFDQRRPGMREAYQLFHEGLIEFADIQHNGICTDEEYYHGENIRIKEEIAQLRKHLQEETEEAKLFRNKTGRTLQINSSTDIGILFYDVLGVPEVRTPKGNLKRDAATIEKFELPFVEQLIRMRKLEKTQGTYLAQFRRESHNGKMHPFIDLNTARSYRSSSSKPNFQNVPVRDEEAKETCRRGITASPANKILEVDFKGIEVGIGACYHKDPNMIAYITDKSTDMHRDSAADTWILPQEEITDDIRFYAKNEFVFPEFYGSWYKECAKNLWEHRQLKTVSGIILEEHLHDHKIHTLEDFENHVRGVENILWYERFPVYRKWKEQVNESYIKRGFVGTFFGFECYGVLTPRKAGNRQIQGTAFHCNLWSLIEVGKVRRKEGWKTKMMGQIHDSILFDLDPSEQDHVIEVVNHITTVRLREEHKWIIVPLSVDYEITPIDGSWVEKEKLDVIKSETPTRNA